MKKQQGFTLIELLVVIAIIGILASVILASLNTARTKAQDSNRVSGLQELAKALNMYYFDNNGTYPGTGHYISNSACSLNAGGVTWDTVLSPALVPNYIGALPADPVGSADANYCYDYDAYPASGVNYTVWTCVSKDGTVIDPDGMNGTTKVSNGYYYMLVFHAAGDLWNSFPEFNGIAHYYCILGPSK